MDGSSGDMSDTTEWLVSTANTTFFNITQADGKATVDEYAQQVIRRFQYVNLAVRFMMGLIAFSTNLLTIVAIASFEYLRSCTNYLIAYLAFADMVAGIVSIFLMTNYFAAMSDILWTKMCAIEQSLSLIAAGSNVMALFGISLDRLIFITFPLRYHAIMTNRVTVVYISLCVVLVVGQVLGLHCCGYIYLPERICTSTVFNTITRHPNITFYIVSILIILPNIRIAYIAYQQSRAIALGQMFEASMNQNKITKMLSVVLGVYYGCYVPQIAVLVMLRYIPHATYGIIIERVSSWIWWVNSWSNPPIYAWKNKGFNKAFRRLLGMKSASIDPAIE